MKCWGFSRRVHEAKRASFLFHEGAVTFALRTGVALVPAGMAVSFKPFRRHRVVVGEPLDLSAYQGKKASKEDIATVNQMLEERVMALTEQAKQNEADTRKIQWILFWREKRGRGCRDGADSYQNRSIFWALSSIIKALWTSWRQRARLQWRV